MDDAAVTLRACAAPGHGSLGRKPESFFLLPGDSGKSLRSKNALIEDGNFCDKLYLARISRASSTVE
jgi:hypothetical protein